MKQKQPFLHVKHEFEPVYDEKSHILILGTFPSVKSREQNFYYGHPQNRFWKVIAALCEEMVPLSIPEKTDLLLRHHIAVWDVIAECDIRGSGDSSIKNVVPTDLSVILQNAPVDKIYANGTKAYDFYMKYSYPIFGNEIIKLPSTSPANAVFGLERLIDAWGQIVKSLF
ncbi:MAG: DNA-deoxyinosine glycosylase [Lachnospiraceae bacterium]|nr:DNA-deoxyinosine glycosylase [Lachnospiraceae bacterium]